MEPLGFKDYVNPKVREFNPQFDLTTLDLKSIRILNRLIHYLASEQIQFKSFFQELTFTQTIKSKNKQTLKIDCLMADKFFLKLYDHGIRNSKEPHPNMCQFLCLDKKYTQYLLLNKIKKCIVDFNSSPYFTSFGTRKRRLPENPQPTNNHDSTENGGTQEYEYYDEEEGYYDEESTLAKKKAQPAMQSGEVEENL